MKIIPAIDILNGKCVRLTKGDYTTQKVYNQNPVEVAKEFEANGIEYIHLVDLDGAKSKSVVNIKTLELIAQQTKLHIDFGGGVKTNQDIQDVFNAGAKQITGGSIAVQNPSQFKEWIQKYGTDRIILGADCDNRKVATNGWLSYSDIDVISFIQQYEQFGIKSVVCTDISKDGMLAGPSIELYQEILKKSTVNLIASGGICSVADLINLQEIGCEGAIIGKAIYEGKVTLNQISKIC